MEIKDKLQKFFDKDIYSICEEKGLYYVILDEDNFIKTVYIVDLKEEKVTPSGISLPNLDSMKLIYSKFNEEEEEI